MGIGGSGAHGARGACRWPARQPCVGAYLTRHPTPPPRRLVPVAPGVERHPLASQARLLRRVDSVAPGSLTPPLRCGAAPLSQSISGPSAGPSVPHRPAARGCGCSFVAGRRPGPRSARPPPPAAGRPSFRMLRTAAAGIVRKTP